MPRSKKVGEEAARSSWPARTQNWKPAPRTVSVWSARRLTCGFICWSPCRATMSGGADVLAELARREVCPGLKRPRGPNDLGNAEQVPHEPRIGGLGRLASLQSLVVLLRLRLRLAIHPDPPRAQLRGDLFSVSFERRGLQNRIGNNP